MMAAVIGISGCGVDKVVAPEGPLGDLALHSMPDSASVSVFKVRGGSLDLVAQTHTPDTLALSPGSYTIDFRKEGFNSTRVTRAVQPGALINVDAALDKPEGS